LLLRKTLTRALKSPAEIAHFKQIISWVLLLSNPFLLQRSSVEVGKLIFFIDERELREIRVRGAQRIR
jgi:hypothetical protein